ncbi:MAG: DUF58 domain-containing protein, partial [Planctomycetota bacterium]|nr:DUF58 domain-containing protein [Planctomycetota bacterium]
MNPLAYLLFLFVPLLGLAYFQKAFPRRPLVFIVLGAALFSATLMISSEMKPFVWGVDILVLLLAIADYWSLPTRKEFSVERQAMRIVSLRKPHDVTLTVMNHGKRDYQALVRDGYPAEFTASPADFAVQLKNRSRSSMEYQLSAGRRGAFELSQVYVRVRSKWGLWSRDLEYPAENVLHVYPDMKQLAEFAILARTDRLSLLGVRRTRKIGQDNEFERLRDYTRDDVFKHIHWRSTARRNKLTVKDFQANQSQRIIFMIDCGRMMTNEAAGLSLLDHALNSMLMMSYVALKQGDSVGLICFSDEIHGYVPPSGGMGQMNRLLHASFDRFPRLVESRYDEAFMYLSSHSRKRSLVVLITNIIDEVNSRQVQQHLNAYVGRHLPLAVLMRDRTLFEFADHEPTDDGELFRTAAAAEILSWRRQVLADLHAKGVLSID